jgi:hypothetical protein
LPISFINQTYFFGYPTVPTVSLLLEPPYGFKEHLGFFQVTATLKSLNDWQSAWFNASEVLFGGKDSIIKVKDIFSHRKGLLGEINFLFPFNVQFYI